MPDDVPLVIQNAKNPKRKYIWTAIITLILIASCAIGVQYLSPIFSDEMKYSSDNYSNGLRLYKDKNYGKALKSFESVIPLDIIRFTLAHGKIAECSKLYLDEEFALAINFAASQQLLTAIIHIDNVLDIDPENEIAIKLKTQYQADLILMTEADAKAKVDAKIKAEADAKAKVEADAKAKDEADAKAAEARVAYDTGITYNQLARTPDNFNGRKVKFSGKVIQVMEGNTEVQLRIAVNNNYDTILYVAYDPRITPSRVLENDYVTVKGESEGLFTYQSTGSGNISIPLVWVDIIN